MVYSFGLLSENQFVIESFSVIFTADPKSQLTKPSPISVCNMFCI